MLIESGPAIGMIAHRTSEEILAHPGLPEARRAYVGEVLALYENDPFMNRLLIEAARSVVFFNAICLHFALDANERATWPTMGLLQRTVAQYGLSSSRRVEDLMARFIQAGYFRSDAAPADRRMRILTPTEKALADDREWLAVHYAPLEIMFPEPGYRLPRARDARFQAAQRRAGTLLTAYSTRIMATNPAVMLFMARDSGSMILMKLIQRADAAEDPSACRISFADLARPFGISRTHVRDMLRDAEAQELLKMRDGLIVLSPSLLAAFDRFVADAMGGHDWTFNLAMRDLEREKAV